MTKLGIILNKIYLNIYKYIYIILLLRTYNNLITIINILYY